ncbi:DUF3597 domain-containing protein [Muricoccus radiodurans]|uniref:DUF3597 domain-containing protein n=1 Tax=Muricoccus radiodurans TaxID=2231721 RepID=UPI003CE8CA5A
MSVFGSILNRVFGRASSRPPVQNTAAPGTQATDTPAASLAPAGGPAAAGGTQPDPLTGGPGVAAPSMATPQAPPQPTAASVPAAGGAPVDVEAVLTDLASKNSQTLNWRQSIVDLMKLLDLDSSLQNRKELAKELGYTGDTNDSATMNVWLHKQVMRKLAENGGHVPASLKD